MIFLIILSYRLSCFKNDKAKDEPAKPIGDYFHIEMKNISENYKDNIDDDIAHLKNFGHISTMTGEFVFNVCKNCGGPMIGHEKEEKDCKEQRMAYDLCGKLQDEVRGHDLFESFKAGIDTRSKEIECKDCGKKFVNRLQRENHDRLVHDGKANIKKAHELEDFGKIIAGAMEKGFKGFSEVLKDNTEKKPVTTQITKAKPPPIWIGGDFERFK